LSTTVDKEIRITLKPDPRREVRTPIRFVLARSFFHDAFRQDYPKSLHAEWLFSYFFVRAALDPSRKICVTSSIVLSRLEGEMRSYRDLHPQTILLFKEVVDVVSMPPADVEIDNSILYVAKAIFDRDIIPLVLSSVKASKWAERAVPVGIKMGLEDYAEGMSEKRLAESIWFAPVSSALCVGILSSADPLYGQLVGLIGQPPRPEPAQEPRS
jgi:hypothetical protein